MADGFEKKESFHAHKLIRLMTKTCAAMEMGPQAFTLVTVVAMQEDCIHYQRPVNYYNEQLMPLCGFASRNALVRAREKAIESGYLKYVPGGKGVPGRYWTEKPSGTEFISDSSVDESPEEIIQPVCRMNSDQKTNQEKGKETDGERDGKRTENGTATGRLSTLTLTLPLKIYAKYPRKVGKADALKAIEKALKRVGGEKLMSAVEEYAACVNRWSKADRAFVPHCATWMNQDRWEDDRSEWERNATNKPTDRNQQTEDANADAFKRMLDRRGVRRSDDVPLLGEADSEVHRSPD